MASATEVPAASTPEMSAAAPAVPAATVLRERSLRHTHQCRRSDSSKKELNQARRA